MLAHCLNSKPPFLMLPWMSCFVTNYPQRKTSLWIDVLLWLAMVSHIFLKVAAVPKVERRLKPIVEPYIQGQQCGFCLGRGMVHQLFTFSCLLWVAWEFAILVYMCFVDLGKIYAWILQGFFFVGYCRSMRVLAHCCRQFNPCTNAVRGCYW